MSEHREAWRSYVGGVAWPTLLLALVVIALEAGAWSLCLLGALPLWAGALVCTLATYLAFTVVHEASHGNVHGDVRAMRGVGELAGWVCALPLLAPYPAFRVLHLRHHSFTNHPTKDPDFHVRGSGFFAVLVNCALIVPSYLRELFAGETSRTEQGRAVRAQSIVVLALMAIAMLGLALSGHGLEVLALWLVPAIVADTMLAFAFDWLPHHPHEERRRFHDTRVIDSGLLAIVLLGQSHHLVHHLWPRVPFYRYVDVFRASRAELERQGAPIVDPLARLRARLSPSCG